MDHRCFAAVAASDLVVYTSHAAVVGPVCPLTLYLQCIYVCCDAAVAFAYALPCVGRVAVATSICAMILLLPLSWAMHMPLASYRLQFFSYQYNLKVDLKTRYGLLGLHFDCCLHATINPACMLD